MLSELAASFVGVIAKPTVSPCMKPKNVSTARVRCLIVVS